MTKEINALRGLLVGLCIRATAASIFFGAMSVPLKAQASVGQGARGKVPDWQVASGGKLSFEVATVKPNTSGGEPKVNFVLGPGDAYAKVGGRLVASNISLLDYIRFAYKLTDGQAQILQEGGPSWVATKRFDIDAKAENPEATKDQLRLMIQTLLAERFELVVHTETRQLPVLALVLAKSRKLGPQLLHHPADDDACSSVVEKSEVGSSGAIPAVCGGLVSVGVPSAPSHVRIGGRKVPIALIAAHLGEMARLARPVVDETGLKGTFDFVLEWGPDALTDSTVPAERDDLQINVQEALQDQLGLRLERAKAAVEVVLIDHVDQRPTEN